MGRIMDRLHNHALRRDKIDVWWFKCQGCQLAAASLCTMFGWKYWRFLSPKGL